MKRLTFVLLASALAFTACEPETPTPDSGVPPTDSGVTQPPGAECSTTISAGSGNSYVPLCEIEGQVQHVRIEGLSVPPGHAAAQVVLGAATAPASAQGPLPAGALGVLFYSGGPPPPAMVGFGFGDESHYLAGDVSFIGSAFTACLDLHKGGATTPPYSVLWIDGRNGADCDDWSTLTLASAFGSELRWSGPGVVNDAQALWFQTANVTARPTVTLFADTALSADAITAFLSMDAGTGTPDAGTETPDAGTETPDAGTGTPDAGTGTPDAGPTCTQTIAANERGSYVELCEVAGQVQHVRLEGLTVPAGHQSAQLVVGSTTVPTSAQAPLESGAVGLLFYSGGPPPPPMVGLSYGAASSYLSGDFAFMTSPFTACLDVHRGGSAPYTVFWVDGLNGADCEDPGTLTLATARGVELGWSGSVNDAPTRWYQSAGVSALPTITLFDTPALSTQALIAEAGTCVTTADGTTNWQTLCTPQLGGSRHYRLDGVSSSMNNAYSYLVVGESTTAPTTNPAAGPGKLIVTMGRSNGGQSWTWIRFDDGTTAQFQYATDTGSRLYVDGPSSVCLDTYTSGNAALRFWATGFGGADCADLSTLTVANALYDSATDAATGAIWDVPLASGAAYVKTSNANASVGSVTVLSYTAL